MSSDDNRLIPRPFPLQGEDRAPTGKDVLGSDIGGSIDMLVDYLAENKVEGIHPLIMGEIERRLIVRALERSRGNKLRAARLLGISRNTLHRKFQQLADSNHDEDPEV